MRHAGGGLDIASWFDGDAFLLRLRLAIALGPRREVRYGQRAAGAPAGVTSASGQGAPPATTADRAAKTSGAAGGGGQAPQTSEAVRDADAARRRPSR